MSEWVNLDVVDGIGPVAVKRRRPREDEDLLDHEATVLSAVDHDGVVRLVERRPAPDPALLTHFVGTHSLATGPPPGIDEATAMVASLARTVADLHRVGVRHGAIDPSHVLIGPGGRPVLCGFSGATQPGAPVDESPRPADDVAAVGRLITRLLAGHDGLEPIPVRRMLRHGRWAGYRQRALLTLADHCQADDPHARPSAASLAATIEELTTPAQPGRPRWRERLRTVAVRLRARLRTPSRGAVRRTGIVVLASVGLLAGAQAWRTVRAPTPAPGTVRGDEHETTTSSPTDVEAAAGGGASVTGPDADRPADEPTPTPCATATPGVDTDGDGCPDGPAVIDGHLLTVGDERFELGRPGDRVLVGNWDCDGLSTAVLVRSDPPGLWHFPDWTAPGETVPAELVSDRVAPASVAQEPGPSGCDMLVAADQGSDRIRPQPVTP